MADDVLTTVAKEKSFLIAKEKTIKIDSSGELIIDGERFAPKKDDGKPVEFDKVKEAAKQTRAFYSKVLSNQFENLIVLSGAGTSVGIGKTDIGKTMTELWKLVEMDKDIGLNDLCSEIKFTETGDLEKLLSKATRAKDFLGSDIEGRIEKIEALIRDSCSIQLPDNSPHETLLNRIVKRKLKFPRTKVFTLNYDTLFEQAAEAGGFTVFDGFSFATKRTFRGSLFDNDLVVRERSRVKNEENFVPKVFHLYKLHGSIDWELQGRKIVQNQATKKPLMIFPKDTKYEHSYEQPFFEMMSRFQQSLRKENVMLITIGFSFNDKHIVTALKEAVSQNPSFQLLIVNRTIRDEPDWKWFLEKASVDSRVKLVAEEFRDFANYYPEDKTITQDELLKRQYGNE